MADMALLRTPTTPLRPSPLPKPGSPSQFLASAQNLIHFDGFLSSRSVAIGRKPQKRAAGVLLISKVRCARASVGGDRRDDRKENQFPPPGELQYFVKLSTVCVAGALVVKYGSLCVPSVTSPNINVALVMVSTPCLVSVVLLALASILGSDGKTRKQ